MTKKKPTLNVIHLTQDQLDLLEEGHSLIIHIKGSKDALVNAQMIVNTEVSFGHTYQVCNYQLLTRLIYKDEGIEMVDEVWEFTKEALVKVGFVLKLKEEQSK